MEYCLLEKIFNVVYKILIINFKKNIKCVKGTGDTRRVNKNRKDSRNKPCNNTENTEYCLLGGIT